MKNIIVSLLLPAIFLVACSKDNGHHPVPPEQLSFTGKWNIDSVNIFFYNAAGMLDSSEIGYPAGFPPGVYYPFLIQFNDDHTWLEAVVVRADTNVVVNGTYSYTSGSTFNLMYPDATPAKKDELCNIISLNMTSFIFSKQLPTIFNGTDSGSVKYVYKLKK